MLVTKTNPGQRQSKMPLLKKLFWLYFLLLIFEGALRKWVLPAAFRAAVAGSRSGGDVDHR